MSNVVKLNAKKVQRAMCNHKNEHNEFDYHMAHNGLCFCLKCGMCMNSKIEYHPGFQYSERDIVRLAYNANELKKFAGRL
jgi:heterodisulfide reductase subunit C